MVCQVVTGAMEKIKAGQGSRMSWLLARWGNRGLLFSNTRSGKGFVRVCRRCEPEMHVRGKRVLGGQSSKCLDKKQQREEWKEIRSEK